MFPHLEGQLPSVTDFSAEEIAERVIELRVFLMQSMELAGRHLAHLARVRFLEGDPTQKRVAVLAGTGAKGCAALACARHLSNWGAQLWVLTVTADEAFTGLAAHQLSALRKMSVPIGAAALPEGERFSLVIDGLLESDFEGSPQGAAAALIQWANRQESPILSVEGPSGLSDRGWVSEPMIQSTATLALGFIRGGVLYWQRKNLAGELYLADVGIPSVMYEWLGLPPGAHPFAKSDIVYAGVFQEATFSEHDELDEDEDLYEDEDAEGNEEE